MRIVSCTRAEAERQLLELAIGWEHFGNEDQADEAYLAHADVRHGATLVRAGHTEFRIQEASAA